MTDDLKPGCVEVAQAVIKICEIIDEHDLTIHDLTNGFCISVEKGHEEIEIYLAMVTIAIEESYDVSRSVPGAYEAAPQLCMDR